LIPAITTFKQKTSVFMDNIILKIQNPEGLFSTGGVSPLWTKRGKVWTTRSGLSCHFNAMGYERAKHTYGKCTVQEFNIDSGAAKNTPATDIIDQWQLRNHAADVARRAKRDERIARWRAGDVSFLTPGKPKK